MIYKMNDYKGEVPLKWLKLHAMIFWKLREKSELISTIHRYNIREYQSCINDILLDMQNNDFRKVYIIKLVHLKKILKLPNLIVENCQELAECKAILESNRLADFSELWCCCNSSDSNVYGRILISLKELFPRIIENRIEIVWGKSARCIEKFPDMKEPFIAIEKVDWSLNYKVKEIIKGSLDIDYMIQTTDKVINMITTYKKAIYCFGQFLKDCGCTNVSLEFSYKCGVFCLIDWDSDNDMIVLDNIASLYKIFASEGEYL